MRLAGPCDSICEDSDVEALEQVLDGRGNLIVVDLLLCGYLVVDAVELEAEGLGLVLGIRDAHDRGSGQWFGCVCRSLDNCVLLELLLEQRPNARDHSDTHGWLGLRGAGKNGVGQRSMRALQTCRRIQGNKRRRIENALPAWRVGIGGSVARACLLLLT